MGGVADALLGCQRSGGAGKEGGRVGGRGGGGRVGGRLRVRMGVGGGGSFGKAALLSTELLLHVLRLQLQPRGIAG